MIEAEAGEYGALGPYGYLPCWHRVYILPGRCFDVFVRQSIYTVRKLLYTDSVRMQQTGLFQ